MFLISWMKDEINIDPTKNRIGSKLGMLEVSTCIDDEPPQVVKEWLSNLYRLNELPFQYLVPSEKYLKMESIRFFHVDANWLRAMTDGALSIGRNTTMDTVIDEALKQGAEYSGQKTASQYRQSIMHVNHLREDKEEDKNEEAVGDLSGFILRSELAAHWTGIDVKGFQDNKELKIYRMGMLDKKILICIFEGVLDKLRLTEPAEAVRFGTKDESRVIRLRKVRDDVGGNTGKTMAIPTNQNGRVNMLELVAKLKNQLSEDDISSAEVALQLICVTDICEFTKGEAKNNE